MYLHGSWSSNTHRIPNMSYNQEGILLPTFSRCKKNPIKKKNEFKKQNLKITFIFSTL